MDYGSTPANQCILQIVALCADPGLRILHYGLWAHIYTVGSRIADRGLALIPLHFNTFRKDPMFLDKEISWSIFRESPSLLGKSPLFQGSLYIFYIYINQGSHGISMPIGVLGSCKGEQSSPHRVSIFSLYLSCATLQSRRCALTSLRLLQGRGSSAAYVM